MTSRELCTTVGLAEGPTRRRHVEGRDSAAVTGGDFKGEALAIEVRAALPILPPVPRHGLPASLRPLDGCCMHIACASNIGDQHQVEVRVTVDGESDSPLLPAWYPAPNCR